MILFQPRTETEKILYLSRIRKFALYELFSYLCKVLCHLFARLLIEKKRPFFLATEFVVSTPLLRHNCYYNIVKF